MGFPIDRVSRRQALIASIAALAPPLTLADTASRFPSGPVRLVVIFPAGGGTDAAARLVAPKLAARLGQPVIVDNRPGMGGGIGMDVAAKAPPDGQTLVLTSSGGLTALTSLYKKLPFDPYKDLAPVSMFGISPLVIAVRNDFPANNAADLIRMAKSKPRSLFYGSGGNGTAPHLAGELFKSTAGVDLVHVPYKGNGPAVISLMGGEIQLVFSDMGTVRPYLGNRLKLLGVLGRHRAASAPDVPTVAESGLPGYDAEGWFAIMAPASTPPDIVQRLNREFVEILGSSETRTQFAASGLEALSSSPAELSRLIVSDTERWSRLIKSANISID